MDYKKLKEMLSAEIDSHVLPWLMRFVDIPNTSQEFDPDFFTNGLIEQACDLCIEYAQQRAVAGLEVKYYKDEGRSPIVFGTIAPTNPQKHKNIMVYGHIDKQPHLTEGWTEGLFPAKAVRRDGLIYGRGVVDDGYNFFTVVSIVKVLQECGIPHDRIILFYETAEESGESDVPYYLEKFSKMICSPEAILCIDSGSINPNLFAITTSLRGIINFDLSVRVLQKGAHSGVAGGIVPSSFRIARQLLARLEDQFTGQIIDELQVKIPEDKMEQASFAAQLVGKGEFEFIGDAQPVSEDPFELYLNNIWRPQLEVIGQEGIPSLSSSGNVLRHQTVLRLSLRLPPGAHWEESFAIVKGKLESSPPYQAEVRVELVTGADGWSSNEVPPKVMKILDSHNEEIFGSKTLMYGTGGSIPFVNMIQDRLPQALVLITGCDLPSSNIHAPDENIDPRFLGRFAQSLACFLADYTTL